MKPTNGRKPDFLVVGAAKAGTTWLQACLGEHPDIYVPKEGELDFFSLYYDRGFDWYSRFFDDVKTETAIGEKSPSYMVAPEAAGRIYSALPDAKLIFVYRNPIERAYSHYCMLARVGAVSKDVDAELQKGCRLVDEGLYYSHLYRFLEYFDPSKVKCMIYEDLRTDARSFIREIYDFLDVNGAYAPPSLDVKHHAKKTLPKFVGVNRVMATAAKKLARSGEAGRAIDRTLRAIGLDGRLRKLNPRDEYPVMSMSKKRFLAEVYAPDVEKLSKWLNRDLHQLWIARHL